MATVLKKLQTKIYASNKYRSTSHAIYMYVYTTHVFIHTFYNNLF